MNLILSLSLSCCNFTRKQKTTTNLSLKNEKDRPLIISCQITMPLFVQITATGPCEPQIFYLTILCENYLQYQQNLYHVFKIAFDRVWHAAVRATMWRRYNINAKLVRINKHLYDKAMIAVQMNGAMNQTTFAVTQGCLFSLILFNIFLERML